MAQGHWSPTTFAPPWTLTKDLTKRKVLPKRMRHMFSVLKQENVEQCIKERNIPEFGPGAVLQLKLAVPENQGRPSTISGIVISRRNRGLHTSFTICNFIAGGGGIERTFPLFSPHILEMRVLEEKRVRRAKLYLCGTGGPACTYTFRAQNVPTPDLAQQQKGVKGKKK